MRKLLAYFLGMWEFRLSLTAHCEDDALLEFYDRGRDMAHRLTFRHWDS